MRLKKPVEEEVKVEETKVSPLELNLDLGRQDLNDNFKKVQDKINELIK